MGKIIIFLILVPVLALIPSGYLIGEGQSAFRIGEKLEFVIQFEFIAAGTATLAVEGIDSVDGYACARLVATARSNKKADVIYKVRDRIESYRDIATGFSRRYIKDTKEGKHIEFKRVDFKPENNQILIQHNLQDPIETQQYGGGLLDVINALYQIRNSELIVGQSVTLDVQDIEKRYKLEVEVQKMERVSVPAGTFDCIVVEPMLKSSGIFRKEGKLQIWITNDSTRMPVMMQSRLVVGSVYALLTNYTRGN